jgi:hypothetical protein
MLHLWKHLTETFCCEHFTDVLEASLQFWYPHFNNLIALLNNAVSHTRNDIKTSSFAAHPFYYSIRHSRNLVPQYTCWNKNHRLHCWSLLSSAETNLVYSAVVVISPHKLAGILLDALQGAKPQKYVQWRAVQGGERDWTFGLFTLWCAVKEACGRAARSVC